VVRWFDDSGSGTCEDWLIDDACQSRAPLALVDLVHRGGQQTADRLALHVGELLVGYLARNPRLFGVLKLAPDRSWIMQLPFGLLMKHLRKLQDPAQRHERQAKKQGERIHVSPPEPLRTRPTPLRSGAR
jgi:hypothetical protein